MKLLIAFLVPLFLISCDVRNLKSKTNIFTPPFTGFKDSTTVQVIDAVYNFNKIKDGEKVEFAFRFKNTGNHPLIIQSANPSCGCTIAEKPEKPVAVGETGTIKAIFNSSGKSGEVHKAVNVISNAYPSFPPLVITGTVIPNK